MSTIHLPWLSLNLVFASVLFSVVLLRHSCHCSLFPSIPSSYRYATQIHAASNLTTTYFLFPSLKLAAPTLGTALRVCSEHADANLATITSPADLATIQQFLNSQATALSSSSYSTGAWVGLYGCSAIDDRARRHVMWSDGSQFDPDTVGLLLSAAGPNGTQAANWTREWVSVSGGRSSMDGLLKGRRCGEFVGSYVGPGLEWIGDDVGLVNVSDGWKVYVGTMTELKGLLGGAPLFVGSRPSLVLCERNQGDETRGNNGTSILTDVILILLCLCGVISALVDLLVCLKYSIDACCYRHHHPRLWSEICCGCEPWRKAGPYLLRLLIHVCLIVVSAIIWLSFEFGAPTSDLYRGPLLLGAELVAFVLTSGVVLTQGIRKYARDRGKILQEVKKHEENTTEEETIQTTVVVTDVEDDGGREAKHKTSDNDNDDNDHWRAHCVGVAVSLTSTLEDTILMIVVIIMNFPVDRLLVSIAFCAALFFTLDNRLIEVLAEVVSAAKKLEKDRGIGTDNNSSSSPTNDSTSAELIKITPPPVPLSVDNVVGATSTADGEEPAAGSITEEEETEKREEGDGVKDEEDKKKKKRRPEEDRILARQTHQALSIVCCPCCIYCVVVSPLCLYGLAILSLLALLAVFIIGILTVAGLNSEGVWFGIVDGIVFYSILSVFAGTLTLCGELSDGIRLQTAMGLKDKSALAVCFHPGYRAALGLCCFCQIAFSILGSLAFSLVGAVAVSSHPLGELGMASITSIGAAALTIAMLHPLFCCIGCCCGSLLSGTMCGDMWSLSVTKKVKKKERRSGGFCMDCMRKLGICPSHQNTRPAQESK